MEKFEHDLIIINSKGKLDYSLKYYLRKMLSKLADKSSKIFIEQNRKFVEWKNV